MEPSPMQTPSSNSLLTSNVEAEPRLVLPADGDADRDGGYVLRTEPDCAGYSLAVYEWSPLNGLGMHEAASIIFLMHGLLTHTSFEWLAPDANNHRVLLRGSIIERLLSLCSGSVGVVGFDHPGHGRSGGLFGYVESHDELRDAAHALIGKYTARRKVVLAMSMGASTAIRLCAADDQLVDCYVLLSPAVRPPDNMFGPKGHVLRFLSPALNYLVPKLPVMSLPPSRDPVIRDACAKDGLLYRAPIRVRMGFEFLRVYADIHEQADRITFPHVVILLGGVDHIVSPKGIREFVGRVKCKSKHVFVFDDLGHDVIRERDSQKAIDRVVQCIDDFLASSE